MNYLKERKSGSKRCLGCRYCRRVDISNKYMYLCGSISNGYAVLAVTDSKDPDSVVNKTIKPCVIKE